MDEGIYLREVHLPEDWSPLLSRLEGWVKQGDRYTDGDGILYDNTQRRFAFEIRNEASWKDLLTDRFDPKEPNKATARTPSGIEVVVYNRSGMQRNHTGKYTLNHIAINAINMKAEGEWWQKFLGVQPTLDVQQGWDPLIDGPLDALHFYKDPNFYVTLRRAEPVGLLHHVGFEVQKESHVDEAEGIIEDIGWEILWKGHLDKSYFIHFQGPDGGVYDISCTSDELKELQERHTP